MKTYSVIKKMVLGVALSASLVWQAGATGNWVAYSVSGGTLQNVPSGNLVDNFFVVFSPIQINLLGVYDPSGFGGNTVKVGIYADLHSIGTLVTPVATFTGSPTTVGGYAYQSIPTMTLGAGTYWVVASGYNISPYNLGGATYIAPSSFGTGPSAYGLGTVTGPVGSTISLASLTQISNTAVGAGTFGFAVPEAGSFALAGVALLGLIYVGRSYSQKLKLA
jgi:hypothetical protein